MSSQFKLFRNFFALLSTFDNPLIFRKFIESHSKKIVFAFGMIFILLLFWGSFLFYRSFMQEKYSAILHESMVEQQMGNLEKSSSLLKQVYEARTAPSGVKSIAALRYAAFLIEEQKKDEALKIYFRLNGCVSCDKFVRNLAGLLAARLISTDEAKMNDPKVLSQLIKIENSSEILRYHIAQERANIAFLKGDLKNSYQIFEMIAKSSDIRQSLKSKAADQMQMIAQKASSETAK